MSLLVLGTARTNKTTATAKFLWCGRVGRVASRPGRTTRTSKTTVAVAVVNTNVVLNMFCARVYKSTLRGSKLVWVHFISVRGVTSPLSPTIPFIWYAGLHGGLHRLHGWCWCCRVQEGWRWENSRNSAIELAIFCAKVSCCFYVYLIDFALNLHWRTSMEMIIITSASILFSKVSCCF